MTILTTPDGTEIYYEIHGDPERTPVVLIHGLGADHSMWDCQIRKYPEMVEKLVIVDSFSSIGGYTMRFNSKLTIDPYETFFKGSPDKTYKLCISRKRRGDAEDTGIFQGTDIGTGDEQNHTGARRSE